MNRLREEYAITKAVLDKIVKNKKKIKKKNREKAKAAKAAIMDLSQAANGSSTSK